MKEKDEKRRRRLKKKHYLIKLIMWTDKDKSKKILPSIETICKRLGQGWTKKKVFWVVACIIFLTKFDRFHFYFKSWTFGLVCFMFITSCYYSYVQWTSSIQDVNTKSFSNHFALFNIRPLAVFDVEQFGYQYWPNILRNRSRLKWNLFYLQ